VANTQALCSAFKTDLLSGYHSFSSTCPARTINTADTFKAALYLASATIDATTTSYSATGEVPNSGSYTAGGATVTWVAPAKTAGTSANASSTTYTTLSASISFTTFTGTAFDCCLIYNSTNNKAVSVHTFGSQTITAGTFTITMPTNDQTTGLIRIT
jgi:hypothetical protein